MPKGSKKYICLKCKKISFDNNIYHTHIPRSNISYWHWFCHKCGFCNLLKPIEVDSNQPIDVKQEGDNGVPTTSKECGYHA